VVGLRGYGQRDPLNEYKSEAFQLFDTLLNKLRETVSTQLMRVEIVSQPEQLETPQMQAHHADPVTGEDEVPQMPLATPASADRDPNKPSSWGKVGRNEPCPCGSGKKYKHCHGQIA
jgi:preprotein translocase subunit SecA